MITAITIVDNVLWRIVRRPLSSFFFTLPFFISTTLSAYIGFVVIPILEKLKAEQYIRKEGPQSHLKKAGTPTMGGVFFVPVALLVSWFSVGKAVEVQCAILATVGHFLIGFLDDFLVLFRKTNEGLPGKLKFYCQVRF